MKVTPKKRVDNIRRNLSLKLPHASIINHRVIWYSASLLLYIWFLGWIAYDIFVWHKPFTQVSTKLFKTPRHVAQPTTPKQKSLKEHEPKREEESEKRKQQQPQPQPAPQEQQQTPPQPQQPKHTTPSIPGCNHNLGYLHQPGNSKEIPDECLTCTQLIQCLTTTKQ